MAANSPIEHFYTADERHYIGDLLDDDDEGFFSWRPEDLKAHTDYKEHHDLILDDAQKLQRSTERALINAPSLNAVGCVPVNYHRKIHIEREAEFTPTRKKRSGKNAKLDLNGNEAKISTINAPSPHVIGYHPIKSNRKDLIAREVDFGIKVAPRSKPNQEKANSELFINVKSGQSFKSKSSPTTRSSSNENVSGQSNRKFESKFKGLEQVANQPASNLLSALENKSDGDDSSSVMSGTSNEFDNETTGSRSSKRRNRAKRSSVQVSNRWEFVNYFFMMLGFYPLKGKKHHRSSHLKEKLAVAWEYLSLAWSYLYSAMLWMIKLIFSVGYQLCLVIGMLFRLLVRKLGYWRVDDD